MNYNIKSGFSGKTMNVFISNCQRPLLGFGLQDTRVRVLILCPVDKRHRTELMTFIEDLTPKIIQLIH
jgi:hypothetical protein